MDSDTFREFAKAAIDFIVDYMENIRDCDVLSNVKPGYLIEQLPKDIPNRPEHWRDILEDIERVIMPGITHWQSPNMHAFYPTACSYQSIVGEMLAAGFSVIGFNWVCSPACTELEVVVMDWLAKFLQLPEHFLHATEGPGGGIIQGSASEAVLVAVIAAREQTVRRIQVAQPQWTEAEIRGKLIGYSSDQSNSCIEKAGVLAALPIRLLPAGDDMVLRDVVLQAAVKADLDQGLIPVISIATLGTTGTCAYDDIASLAPICTQHNIWLHVDAAYAGAAFALDECAELRSGLELVDSLNFNLHKFLMVNFDCAAMWLRDANRVVESFNVDRIYLKHKYEGQSQIPDFRHWQIPLGRRFRALKVWITFRSVGAEGLRAHVRKHIALAQRFQEYVRGDKRFEIVSTPSLGLVCFRACGDNSHTTNLLHAILERKKLYMVQAVHRGKHFLRFVVCGMDPKPEDIDFAWKEIQTQLTHVLQRSLTDATTQPEIIADPPSINKADIGAISQQLANDLHIGNGSVGEKSK